MSRYDLVFKGETLPGRSRAEVLQKLANLLKSRLPQTDVLLCGKPVIIGMNVDDQNARKYKTAFERAGAVLNLVPVDETAPHAASPQPLAASCVKTPETQDRHHRPQRADSARSLAVKRLAEKKAQQKSLQEQEQREREQRKKEAQDRLLEAQRAFEEQNVHDPERLARMGETLGKNGQKKEGLALLERGADLDKSNPEKWYEIIGRYKQEHKLASEKTWQFIDKKGKTFLETSDKDLIRKGLLDGSIPVNSRCTCDRIPSTLQPVKKALSSQFDDIFHPIRNHMLAGAVAGTWITGAIGAIGGGLFCCWAAFMGVVASDTLEVILNNLIPSIAAIIIMFPLIAVLFVLVLTVCATIAGIVVAIPGGVVGGMLGIVAGILRYPFMKRPPLPKDDLW